MLAILDDVHKKYHLQAREIVALRNVNLSLDAGQFVAVCGPSGCGKSTMLLSLGGLLRPDRGRIIVDQADLYGMTANERARFRASRIGFVFQQFHLVPYLSVLDNVLTAQLGADKLPDARQRANELLERFGLSDRRNHRPAQLSTGERQRTALARALLNSPKLLLADEPTGNLDRANAERVLDDFVAFTEQGGAVLMVTHDAQAANRADCQMTMDRGRLTESAEV